MLKIISTIKGKERYRPNLKFGKNITSNIFRVFEFIFGREVGIKKESSGFAGVDKFGKHTEYVIAYSTEAKIAFFEEYIKNCVLEYIKYISRIKVKINFPRFDNFQNFFDIYLPEFAFANVSYLPPTKTDPFGIVFAIAINTSANNTANATTVTISSYTVTGSDILMANAVSDQANTGSGYATNVTGVTCNAGAQNMVKRDVAKVNTSYGTCIGMWLKLGAASGAITGTRATGGDAFAMGVATYSGVDQTVSEATIASSKIEANTTSNPQATPTVTSPTNGWTACAVYISTAGSTTAGSGTTLRTSASTINHLFDSNGPVTGTTNLNFVPPGTALYYGAVICAFGVAGASSTKIKSWNGVANV